MAINRMGIVLDGLDFAANNDWSGKGDRSLLITSGYFSGEFSGASDSPFKCNWVEQKTSSDTWYERQAMSKGSDTEDGAIVKVTFFDESMTDTEDGAIVDITSSMKTIIDTDDGAIVAFDDGRFVEQKTSSDTWYEAEVVS